VLLAFVCFVLFNDLYTHVSAINFFLKGWTIFPGTLYSLHSQNQLTWLGGVMVCFISISIASTRTPSTWWRLYLLNLESCFSHLLVIPSWESCLISPKFSYCSSRIRILTMTMTSCFIENDIKIITWRILHHA
jgi:hypothetical protein